MGASPARRWLGKPNVFALVAHTAPSKDIAHNKRTPHTGTVEAFGITADIGSIRPAASAMQAE